MNKNRRVAVLLIVTLLTIFLCGATTKKEIQLNAETNTDFKVYSQSESLNRSLAGEKIKYRIPKYWNDKEISINTLPSGYGYQYKLDDNYSDTRVENLSVFYFSIPDNVKEYKDYKEIAGIERAVIQNICPDEELSWNSLTFKHFTFPTLSVKAYGKKFDYYRAAYKNHVVEFVFTEAQDGLCVMVYVYKDTKFVDDIMYVISTIEV